jgi:pimeloyl-ACP methyl ester carboxylesterase
MTPLAWWRVFALLRRLVRPGSPLPASVAVARDLEAGGVAYDLYAPRRDGRGLVVAVHGATLNGRKDVRLEHFAGVLAGSGMTCAVPTLPGLGSLSLAGSDVAELAGFAIAVPWGHRGPLGLIGFSWGGSVALLAATWPSLAPRLSWVITMGAYHDLASLLEKLGNVPEPSLERPQWDGWAYARLAEVYRRRVELSMSESEGEALAQVLCAWCDALQAEAKRQALAAFRARLERLRGCPDETRRPEELAALSPRGHLSGLDCPVSVLHDPEDDLVPVNHAHRLLAELTSSAPGYRHRLLVTPLLGHVMARRPPSPIELVALARAVRPLVD